MDEEQPQLPELDSVWTWQGQEQVTVIGRRLDEDGWWIHMRGTEGATWTPLDFFERHTDWSSEK